jgi:hypothetical protein
MANEKITDSELRRLCDEIAARDGVVRINLLREAAGGGSYARLARVVDAWGRERGHAAPRPLRLGKRRAERAGGHRQESTGPGPTVPGSAGTDAAGQAMGERVGGERGGGELSSAAALLREENEMLWRMLREEREARLAEIDRLNRLMDIMSRHVQVVGGPEHRH